MTYLLTVWNHSFQDEPLLIFSELDDERWEVRKVEVYSGGRIDYAGRQEATGTSFLSEAPIPPKSEIEGSGEFVVSEISRGVFEALWARRHSASSRPAEQRQA